MPISKHPVSLEGIFYSLVDNFHLAIGLKVIRGKKCFLIPSSSHRSMIFLLSNCWLLSVIIEWRMSNLHMIFFYMNLEVSALVILDNGSASTHMLKYPMATIVKFTFSLPLGHYPIRTIFHFTNGHGLDTMVSTWEGCLWILKKRMHLSHSRRIDCIFFWGGPIIPLSQHFICKCWSSSMIITDSLMDFS